MASPDAPVATSAGTRTSSAQAIDVFTSAIVAGLPESSATSEDDRNRRMTAKATMPAIAWTREKRRRVGMTVIPCKSGLDVNYIACNLIT